ncbi:unnamed protein product [Victoria cruziana]
MFQHYGVAGITSISSLTSSSRTSLHHHSSSTSSRRSHHRRINLRVPPPPHRGVLPQAPMQVIPPGEPESRSAERGAACPPFPKALEKPSSVYRPVDREVRMRDMLEIFRAVRINLPLLDAIQQVPAYARFLKKLCTRKKKSRRVPECVMLSEGTSSLLQRRLPPKLEDPGALIIPCVLGDIRVEIALLDLGASVNVLPRFF